MKLVLTITLALSLLLTYLTFVQHRQLLSHEATITQLIKANTKLSGYVQGVVYNQRSLYATIRTELRHGVQLTPMAEPWYDPASSDERR